VPKSENQKLEFENYLIQSIKPHSKFLADNNAKFGLIDTIYIGGGTPSLWKSGGATFFSKFINKLGLIFSQDCEFTLEVNPGSWEEKGIRSWESIGTNRYSIGIQSLSREFLSILDRVHTLDESYRTLEFFSGKNANFSVDFMLGLPRSKEIKRDVIKELESVLMFNPTHLSLYILTVNNRYIHFDSLPDEDWIANEYLDVSKYLRDKGYLHYEVSNFSLKGFESRHNLKYWDSASVAAFGPSATGFLKSDNSGLRYKWKVSSPEYELEKINEKQIKLERLYLNLRTNHGTDITEYITDGLDESIYLELKKKWNQNDFLEQGNEKLRLTPKGYLMLDSVVGDIIGSSKYF
jgi:oxygen-independent coproporphyrinogen III oxidase